MITTVQWDHPAGHAYLYAVLALTKLTLRPDSGVFEVEFGVWENETAYKMKAEALYQDVVTYAVATFPSLNDVLQRVSTLLCDRIDNISIPEEENQ